MLMMALVTRITLLKNIYSSSLPQILKNIRVKLIDERNANALLKSRHAFKLCTGIFAFSLGRNKDQNNNVNALKNIDNLIVHNLKETRVDPVKRRGIFHLIYCIYEFICILLRSFRLGATFIPIVLLYPITYAGEYFERLWWRLLLTRVESCGPIFIKLGQWVSTRHDLFPPACCHQFARLQRRTRPHPWEHTKKVLQRAFGKNWRKIFVKFDNNREPIGSGCVAQVYKVWISSDHIPNEEILEELSSDQDDDNQDYSSLISDGLEILGFGNYFHPSHKEDFEQAFMEWQNYRNEKRAAMQLSSLKDSSHNVSSQSTGIEIIESLAGELADDIAHNKDPTFSDHSASHCTQSDESDLKGESDAKSIFAEEWLESLDAFEKSLPIEESHTDNLESLIPVAVKVLHPGIQHLFRRDMAILHFSAIILSYLFPPLRWLALPQCVDEFSKIMSSQIDMREEAKNLRRFADSFSKVETVRFPLPFLKMVTSKVLVESFEEGEPITDIIASSDLEKLKQNLANIGVEALLKMVFIDNFTHGDLHPGNVLVQNRTVEHNKESQDGNAQRLMMVDVGSDIFVMDIIPDPNPLRICLLDCGVVSTLDEKELGMFKLVMKEVVKGNGESVAELFLKHSEHKCTNSAAFKCDMVGLIDNSLRKMTALEKVNIGNLLHEVLSLLMRHKVRLDPSFGSVIISMIVLEGLGRTLDPSLDILHKARPFLLY